MQNMKIRWLAYRTPIMSTKYFWRLHENFPVTLMALELAVREQKEVGDWDKDKTEHRKETSHAVIASNASMVSTLHSLQEIFYTNI